MKLLAPLVFCALLSAAEGRFGRDEPTSCKPLKTSFCQGLGYASTPYPDGAPGFSLIQIGKMVKTECSEHIATLMCRVAVPECHEQDRSPKKPCRSLCEKVKKDCDATLSAKWLFWPMRLRCDALPASDCVEGQAMSATQPPPASCQTISVPLCSDLPYSDTVLPNALGHTTQQAAGLELQVFSPLIQGGCSPHLKPFLCSLYTPRCVAGRPRPPCRALCQQARADCEGQMSPWRIRWPVRCEDLPPESCESAPPNAGPVSCFKNTNLVQVQLLLRSEAI